jgi:hypothetical protein
MDLDKAGARDKLARFPHLTKETHGVYMRPSNEDLLRPRVARAQEPDRRPRLFESFLLPECFFQEGLYLAFGCH